MKAFGTALKWSWRQVGLVVNALICLSFSVVPLCFTGCGSSGGREDDYSSSMQRQGPGDLSKKLMSGFEDGEDEQGNPRVRSDRRSQFEGRNFGQASGDFAGKDYSTSEYRKKRWQGNRDAYSKSFEGRKTAQGYDRSPHFVKKNAALSRNANLTRSNYQTSEIAKKNLPKSQGDYQTQQSAYTQSRRGNTPAPLIIPYRDQQNMTVEDTKSLLKR